VITWRGPGSPKAVEGRAVLAEGIAVRGLAAAIALVGKA
jgi:hypothetical protein